jgi:hypothetical protein
MAPGGGGYSETGPAGQAPEARRPARWAAKFRASFYKYFVRLFVEERQGLTVGHAPDIFCFFGEIGVIPPRGRLFCLEVDPWKKTVTLVRRENREKCR